MKTKTRFALILVPLFVLAYAFLAPVLGEEKKTVTLEGKLVCALCTLAEKGRTECQNVLQVTSESGEVRNYYVAATEAGAAFGHVCKSTPAVRVTGTLVERDGTTWIEPTKIERMA